jgi:hypothetical protein
MNADRYTKSVLTVIAVSLSIIAGEKVISVATADARAIQRVAICDPYESDRSSCALVTASHLQVSNR